MPSDISPRGLAACTSVVIPVLNARAHLPALLARLKALDPAPTRVLFIDSQSSDDTALLVQQAGFDLLTIQRSEFGHGRTRNLALAHCADSQYLVFLTQDALPQGTQWLSRLLLPMARNNRVALVYGRQVPRTGATPAERHAREFNYPRSGDRSEWRDLATRGIKALFCSNSFAAWRRSALAAVGGFPEELPMGEDMAAALRLLQAGHVRVYEPRATAVHSHDYTLLEELRRYFDIGALLAIDPLLRQVGPAASGEGWRFLRKEWAGAAASWRIDRMVGVVLRTAAKSVGYALGRRHARLPKAWLPHLSMHRHYWSPRCE